MDDERYDAVRERLGRFARTSDHRDVLAGAGLRDVRALLASAPDPGPAPRRKKAREARRRRLMAQHTAGMLLYTRHVVTADPAVRAADGALAQELLAPVLETTPDTAEQLARIDDMAERPLTGDPPTVIFDPRRMLTYIDGQIATQRLEIDAITDPEERNPLLMAVAGLHHQRAMRTSEVGDVEDALLLVDAVLAVTPDDHPTRPGRLNYRALYLRDRLVLLDDREGYGEAVAAARAAFDATPEDHMDRPMHQSNLAMRVMELATARDQTDLGELDEAVDLAEAACRATPVGDEARATRYHGLHTIYLVRFLASGWEPDLDRSIEAGRTSVEATSLDHTDLAARILSVSSAYLEKFRLHRTPELRGMALSSATMVLKGTERHDPTHQAARHLRDAILAADRAR